MFTSYLAYSSASSSLVLLGLTLDLTLLPLPLTGLSFPPTPALLSNGGAVGSSLEGTPEISLDAGLEPELVPGGREDGDSCWLETVGGLGGVEEGAEMADPSTLG